MRMWIYVAFLSWTFVSSLMADESFLSNDEYAKMLYKNPRGIGCDRCHGSNGEGKVIASYLQNGKKVYIKAPAIDHLSMDVFKKALSRSSRLMPEYFLTDSEKAYLYFYLTKNNLSKKAKK